MNKTFSGGVWLWGGAAFLAIVVFVRLWRICANDFIFYDEGMYLGYNRFFLYLVQANPPAGISELFTILSVMAKTALTTAKALWFFVLNLRVFFTGADGFYFARLLSAVAGVMTIALTFVWAKRYFNCKKTAVLSAAFLAILPSHVFYSRLGMQESLSTLLFLAGMYLYFFSNRLSARVFYSAIILSAVFFCNYRMIIAPLFVLLAQGYVQHQARQSFDVRKALWFLLTFYGIVFVVGSLDDGVNTYVTFGWIFHQADQSHSLRSWVNFLSFPYYVFKLENIFFGLLFFASAWVWFKKLSDKMLPFVMVLAQMALFSFAAEKGARYLCVVLPFMAMAAAHTAMVLLYRLEGVQKKVFVGLLCLASAGLIVKSLLIATAVPDYGRAVGLILKNDPQAKIISTQPVVEALYFKDDSRVVACPKDLPSLLKLYQQGYRYLVLDPQAYISWTQDGQLFTRPLVGVLSFIHDHVPPLVTLPHFNKTLLTRFVLDHNQNLLNSLKFLNAKKGDLGQIRIYDLNLALALMKGYLSSAK